MPRPSRSAAQTRQPRQLERVGSRADRGEKRTSGPASDGASASLADIIAGDDESSALEPDEPAHELTTSRTVISSVGLLIAFEVTIADS